jgi:hypothetical protein
MTETVWRRPPIFRADVGVGVRAERAGLVGNVALRTFDFGVRRGLVRFDLGLHHLVAGAAERVDP